MKNTFQIYFVSFRPLCRIRKPPVFDCFNKRSAKRSNLYCCTTVLFCLAKCLTDDKLSSNIYLTTVGPPSSSIPRNQQCSNVQLDLYDPVVERDLCQRAAILKYCCIVSVLALQWLLCHSKFYSSVNF
jgi:hypothetical protein